MPVSFAYDQLRAALTPSLSHGERVTLTRISLSLSLWQSPTFHSSPLPVGEGWGEGFLNRRRSRYFAGRKDNRDSISDRYFISNGSSDICQNARGGRFDLHRGLVGFDLHERLALGNRLAFGFEPIEQRSFFLRDSQRRHDYIGCHSRWLLIMESLWAEGAMYVGATGQSPLPFAYRLVFSVRLYSNLKSKIGNLKSPNHFIRPVQHRLRNGQADLFRGLEIDYELKLHRLFHR